MQHSYYHQQDSKDKSVIRNAMIVLFLALLIVYLIRRQVSGKDMTNVETSTGDTTMTVQNLGSIADSLDTIPSVTGLIQTGNQTTIGNPDVRVDTGTAQIPTEQTGIQQNDSSVQMLSGTNLYFGPIEAIDEMGITYKYALKDSKNIYYVYLGSEDVDLDLASIVRAYSGTLYVMNTAQDIVNNQLFGDKVTFINIPKYKNITVLMIVQVGVDQRLIQVAYPIYHQSKLYIKDLFTR